ncbi:MAG: Two component, Sigma-54 Specific, central transcriptional regulator of acidic amino acid uptake [uncultured Paraburkholderia sp.]|nr:MAG: Two component, Sigma-54 Specific, central transcriptional regulator of acidic amino acid uptake [uncultured Paraburkholderia sp.]CAH2929364.1 MAG: Two component, Sigma-54 Specific, central transcriptional regulator of acidic amino acid uptake [uncultured Paraburkholderia sp.]
MRTIFIEKPFASERLIETVRRKLVLENLVLRRELAEQNSVAPRTSGAVRRSNRYGGSLRTWRPRTPRCSSTATRARARS